MSRPLPLLATSHAVRQLMAGEEVRGVSARVKAAAEDIVRRELARGSSGLRLAAKKKTKKKKEEEEKKPLYPPFGGRTRTRARAHRRRAPLAEQLAKLERAFARDAVRRVRAGDELDARVQMVDASNTCRAQAGLPLRTVGETEREMERGTTSFHDDASFQRLLEDEASILEVDRGLWLRADPVTREQFRQQRSRRRL